MAHLELYLFGPPRLLRDGRTLEVSLRKVLALFAYLAITKQPHSRDALATLLWPETGQREARASLRRTLYRLNETLGEDLLITSADTVCLHPQVDLQIDVEQFLELSTPIDGPEQSGLEQWIAAADLYRDDFMAGFSLPDSPTFDDWQFFQREELRRRLAALLEKLAHAFQRHGDFDQAILYARRWLQLDTLNEAVHRQLMQLYVWAGQHTAAQRQYAECVRILDEELGAPPDAETQALFEAIRTKRLPPPAAPRPPGDAQPMTPRPIAPAQTTRPPHNLPAQVTPFVGRTDALAEISERLCNPACRLLTLVGPGGVGKTRLALQAAQQLYDAEPDQHRFADGVFWVALAPIPTSGGMAPAMAEAIGWVGHNDRPILEQLVIHLRDKRMLLVLDNVEHLLDGAEQLSAILSAAQGVKLLVTSREALNLTEEWFHPVMGMAFPLGEEEDFEDIEGGRPYDAVRLFEQCALRADWGFALAAHQRDVVRICRLVDGMPLALELAASWLKTLPPGPIADEIERNIDILTAQQRNIPQRHRSMRAVLEQTWAMLAPKERAVLMRLSLFRGGFRQDAAAQVAGASLLTLAGLVERSLVRTTPTGRYQMHELLRQFAAEQLLAHPEATQETRRRHARYYLQFMADHDTQLLSKHQPQALERVNEEVENIRLALASAIGHDELGALHEALEPLWWFFWTRSRVRECVDLYGQMRTELQALDSEDAATERLPRDRVFQRLSQHLGLFHFFLGNYEQAERDLMASLMLCRRLELPKQLADTLVVLGAIAVWQGERTTAQERLAECQALYEQLGDQHGLADVVQERAMLHAQFGDFDEARRLAHETLAISRDLERVDWIAWGHDAAGWASFLLGDFDAAATHYRSALAGFEQLNHDRGRSLALGGLGMVAWADGDPIKAQSLNEQSLALCRKIGLRLHIASRLSFLGLILNELGDHQGAQALAHEGLTIASELNSRNFMAYNLICLAEAAYGQRNFALARSHLREVLSLTAQLGLLPAQLMGLYFVGDLLLQEATHAQARQAAPLLRLVALHPASWAIFRQRSQRLLTKCEFTETRAIQPADLSATVDSLIAAL
ncbi:MAG: tetratricopeptide repeat protein [Caldilineaceae bacterium]|nr:tetratricopeptide repeat protein [Caldilineaceae bacterium]